MDTGGELAYGKPVLATKTYKEYPCRYAYKGCPKVTLNMYNTAQHECSCKFRYGSTAPKANASLPCDTLGTEEEEDEED